MKFHYYIPPEEETPQDDLRFAPSIAFTQFLLEDDNIEDFHEAEVFCRQIPHIIKLKVDFLDRFRTGLILFRDDSAPDEDLEKDKALVIDLSMFMGGGTFDYIVGGVISLEKKSLKIQIYSTVDGKVVLEKSFVDDKNALFGAVNNFIKDFVGFFEINGEKGDEVIYKRPVSNSKSFVYLLEALDIDPWSRPNSVGGGARYIRKLKRCLENDPGSNDVADILIEATRRVYRKGKGDLAENLSDFVLSLCPYNRQAHLLKSTILVNAGRTGEAVSALRELLKTREDALDIPFILGQKFLETGLLEAAEEMFRLLLDFEPDNPELYDNYGYLLIHQGKQEKALAIFLKGAEKYPDRKYLLINIAQILTDLGRIDEAHEVYQKSLAIFHDCSRLMASYAIHMIHVGEIEKARAYIKKAIMLNPEDPLINLIVATVYLYLKDEEGAQRYARTAIDLQPKSRVAEEARDLLCRISGKITEEEQQQNRNRFIEALRLLGEKENETCLSMLEEVTRTEPAFWNAWFAKGIIHRRMGDLDAALESLSHVEDLFSDQVSLHHEIARCLMAKENFQEAYPHILYAFRKRPQDPIIMANMALIYMHMGKLDEAELLFNHVRKFSPISVNLDPYLEELERLKKRKKSTQGNGGDAPVY